MDLNNRRTGKDATKHRALGLLGHSESCALRIAPFTTTVFQIEIDLHRTAGRIVVKIIGHFGRNP